MSTDPVTPGRNAPDPLCKAVDAVLLSQMNPSFKDACDKVIKQVGSVAQAEIVLVAWVRKAARRLNSTPELMVRAYLHSLSGEGK